MKHCDHMMRVRYAETDQMGVAYYANYLVWFEVGRAEFCRRQGFSYREMEQSTESYLMVVEAFCRYLRPLRYDMPFVVRTTVKQFRKKTLTFAYTILDPEAETVLARGETKHVIADRQGRLKAFPQEYRKFLEVEAG